MPGLVPGIFASAFGRIVDMARPTAGLVPVANGPEWTLARIPCCSGKAGFSPYKSARLRRYDAVPEPGDGHAAGGLVRAFAIFVVNVLFLCGPCLAQSASPALLPGLDRELVIGTKEAPPFAMKAADGAWEGISIDLWRRVADEKKWRYRFVEVQTVPELIDGVATSKFDVAVAALTVTPARERRLDFTASFFSTGLGIAVAAGGLPSWRPVLTALTSFGFIQSILALVGLALAVGLIVWLLERRHNEDFGGGVVRGLSSSVWWTTVAMTQRGIGNFGPRTMPGRAVAMLWMVGSIIAIAVFTAGITSALTVRKLQGSVREVADLSTVRVGAVNGTTAEEVLFQLRVWPVAFATPKDALLALRAGNIDAVVYDRPLLAWFVKQDFQSSIQLLDTIFDFQNYAFAVPLNSPLRKPIGVAVLDATESPWWGQIIFRYTGTR
jgi:ABC-type amino acid transport substrate-binding protein